MSGSQANDAWNTFKNLYLSTKQSIEYKYRNEFGISNNCYNGCIGDSEFNMFENDFAGFSALLWDGSFFTHLNQACGLYKFFNYSDKTPRFIKNVGDYDMTSDPASQFLVTSVLLTNDFYLETGLCPIDVHLESLLNKMTVSNQLTATNIPMLGINEFTPTLYSAVSGVDSDNYATNPYQPYQWSSTVSGAVLTIQFTGAASICNQITLQLPSTVSYDWVNYGSGWKITSWEQLVPNGGSFNFSVLVHIDEDLTDPNNALVQKVIFGTTCLPIGQCEYGFNICKDNMLAPELMQLFNGLLTSPVREGIVNGVAKALTDKSVKALVLICDGKTFIAGADISEFGKAPTGPSLFDALNAIENASIPVVAAIHGTALGGGLEVALTCHYRVAVPSAKCACPK